MRDLWSLIGQCFVFPHPNWKKTKTLTHPKFVWFFPRILLGSSWCSLQEGGLTPAYWTRSKQLVDFGRLYFEGLLALRVHFLFAENWIEPLDWQLFCPKSITFPSCRQWSLPCVDTMSWSCSDRNRWELWPQQWHWARNMLKLLFIWMFVFPAAISSGENEPQL